LTDDQKLQRFSVCENLIQRANDDENLLKNVIISDERWVYVYDVRIKQQSCFTLPQESTAGAPASESSPYFF
jgi:hypothetical protein